MPFGFAANHEETLEVKVANLDELLERSILLLGWKHLGSSDGKEWMAKVSINWYTWGEIITIRSVNTNKLTVRSHCVFPLQCVDWGKNRENVKRLRETIKALILENQSL